MHSCSLRSPPIQSLAQSPPWDVAIPSVQLQDHDVSYAFPSEMSMVTKLESTPRPADCSGTVLTIFSFSISISRSSFSAVWFPLLSYEPFHLCLISNMASFCPSSAVTHPPCIGSGEAPRLIHSLLTPHRLEVRATREVPTLSERRWDVCGVCHGLCAVHYIRIFISSFYFRLPYCSPCIE